MAKAYRHLKDYAKLVASFPWVDSKHIDLICEHLEAVERGEIKRLIINIPPGYAKSYLCSRCFPCWALTRHPDWEFLLTSYGDDLAEEHSAAARQFYTYWAPKMTGATVSNRSQAVDRWLVDVGKTHLGGGMRACGVLSAVTGRRADIAVIDDPFKNWKEASSHAVREGVWTNYQSAIRNRLRPGGRIVVIHNRWHKDDLTGRLTQAAADGTGEDWVVLRLPARAIEEDCLGRRLGDPLWPNFYDSGELDAMELAAGPFFWASQHQQAPEDVMGMLFKRAWFHYWHWAGNWYALSTESGEKLYHPNQCIKFQTVDTNGSSSTAADYFVVSTWAMTPDGDLILLCVYREHIGVEEHIGVLRDQYHEHLPGVIYVEKKTFGVNLIAAAESEGLPVEGVPADVDKLTRCITALTKYRSGKVYHPRAAPWLEAIEHELIEFPGGSHDDFVDTVSIAGIQSVEFAPLLSTYGVGVSSREIENTESERVLFDADRGAPAAWGSGY